MRRRKRSKNSPTTDYLSEHPPACCRAFIAKRTLRILDELTRKAKTQPEVMNDR